MLIRAGAKVRLASREAARAELACQQLAGQVGEGASGLSAVGTSDASTLEPQLSQVNAVFGCGAAGAQLLSQQPLRQASDLKVAIDLNAVPPQGREGIAARDKAVARGSRIDYGAIDVGGLEMKIHRESICTLFSRNDLVLDAEQIFEIGRQLELAAIV